jgi:transcriptional regulator with XRE-family HTH domain
MDFGAELKKLRLKAGLKQIEVATALGYGSSQFVSNWERSVSWPPIKQVKTLARLYNIAPEKLFMKLQKAYIRKLQEEFDATVDF